MEIELEFLTHLKETDRSHLPAALQSLDKGHLTFVKKEFLAFVREVDFNFWKLSISMFIMTRSC